MLCILFKLLNNLNEVGSFASVTDKEIELFSMLQDSPVRI